MNAFIVSLGPAKCLLSVMSCISDPTQYSVGYSPIIFALDRCFSHISDTLPDLFVTALVKELRVAMLNSRVSAAMYYKLANSDISNAVENELQTTMEAKTTSRLLNDIFVSNLLCSASVSPLQELCDANNPHLLYTKELRYAEVLGSFLICDFLVSAVCCMLSSHKVLLGSVSCYPILSLLLDQECVDTFEELFTLFYIPTLKEHFLARDLISKSNFGTTLTVHPTYTLMVITSDVWIRDGIEDDSKKLEKLPKGAIVYAYERNVNSNNGLRYHLVDGGWIGLYKSTSSAVLATMDPQIIVINMSSSLEQDTTGKVIGCTPNNNNTLINDNADQSRFYFEKYANVSPMRAGFMTMFRFHHAIKNCISNISHYFLVFEGAFDSKYVVHSAQALKIRSITRIYLPMVTNTMECVALMVNNCVTKQIPSTDKVLLKDNWDSKSIRLKGKGSAKMMDEIFEENGPENYFCDFSSSLEEFSIAQTFAIMHALDLFRNVLYDDKIGNTFRGWSFNITVLYHMYHSGCLERILQGSVQLFLCCLIDAKEEANCTEMDVANTVKSRLRILRDRRLYACSKIDFITQFWQRLIV